MNNKAKILFLLTLFVGILLEGTITTIPLVFNILLVWFVLSRDNGIFFLSFVCGVLLDSLGVQKIGISSLYFVVALFVIILYEKKFETKTMPFVLLFSFLGSLGYLVLTQQQYILQQAIVSSLISSMIFHVLSKSDPNLRITSELSE